MAFITTGLGWEILATVTTILIGAYFYIKWKFTFWEKQSLPTLIPTVPFGNAKNLFLGRQSWGEQFAEIYKTFKEKDQRHCGFYLGPSASYVPIDIELVKHIMQVDFHHFNSHGGYVDEESDPLSGHLFNLEDEKWRSLRVKLTPTFTSGKMKMMFHTIANEGLNLKSIVDQLVEKHEAVDIRDVLSRYGTDVISSVAFGLECGSLKNPEVPFRVYGKKAVEFDIWDTVKIFLQVVLPHCLLRAMKHKFTKRDVEQFFLKAIQDTVEYREKNNVYRKDFLHLLIQLKNRGVVEDDGKITDETGKAKEIGLTINQLAAQSYVFFMAGYETSSTVLTFTLSELALNPDIQDKLREEVNSVLAKHDDKLTYDAIVQMTYMDKVIHETLRKYPPLPILTRLCTKDYNVPNSDICLKKGLAVIIPVLGIHKDPEYYPNPEVFDPERFSEENKQTRPGFTWLPFGDGPRICIGMRFGMLQSKVALTTFINNYYVKLNEKTKLPITFDKRAFVSKVQGGVWLDFEKIK